jgi:hypothetical protein
MLLTGLAGVALLLGASLALISWSTGDAPELVASAAEAPRPQRPPAVAPAAPPAPAELPAAAPSQAQRPPPAAAVGAGSPTPPPRAPASRRLARAQPPSTGGPPADKGALRLFRRELKVGLAGLEQDVAPCALENASFTLAVETVDGGLRIVDARPAPGVARDAGAACARKALLGQVIPAPSARPGRRWEMPFSPRASS